ncbi:MAG: hypothetical protein IEMM0003_0274 [bacterium]|nr:MAG: hypothetical protein IEMM0003_0274 [bacterium]
MIFKSSLNIVVKHGNERKTELTAERTKKWEIKENL